MTTESEILSRVFVKVMHMAFDDARKDVIAARRKQKSMVRMAIPSRKADVAATYQENIDRAIASHRRYFESRDYHMVCTLAGLFIRPDDMMRAVCAEEVKP